MAGRKWRGGHLVGHVVLILRDRPHSATEGQALLGLLPLTLHDGERIVQGNVACMLCFRMSPHFILLQSTPIASHVARGAG